MPLPRDSRETQTPAVRPQRLRLAVLDTHQLFRECVAAALRDEGDFAVVEVADGDEAALARLGRDDAIDVLLLGGCRGERLHGLVRAAQEASAEVKILILGGEEGQQGALDLLRAGAKGYLFRDQSLAELRAAILEVAAGETVCTPHVAHLLFSHLGALGRERQRDEQLDFLELTPRELEILQLIADGLKNQEIAKRLNLSVHTVKNHVHNILDRLGVKSRWSAVTHASDRGWLQSKRRFPS
jgi:two-component system, NarL family, nitrate/nitrite response regulator NarL